VGRRTSGFFVSFALLVAAGCTGRGDGQPEPITGSGSQLTPEASAQVRIGTGPSVSFGDGTDVPAIRFSEVAGDVALPVGFNRAGPPVEIDVPQATIVEPVLVSVQGREPPVGAFPLLLHRNGAGFWESIPALFVDGRYEAEAMSFSWYWPGWADSAADWIGSTTGKVVDAAGNVVDAGFDWVTGRTDPPEPCGSDPYPWVSSSGSPPDGAFHVCLERNPGDDGSERVEVKVKSNRAFAMWVVVPRDGADYVWIEGSSWDLVGPVLMAFAGGPSERVLLGPGRTVTVGYRRPSAVAAQLQFFAYQDTITQLFTLLTRHVGEVNAELATLLATISCFDVGVEGLGEVSWDRGSDCVGAALGATANQVELAYDRTVASGRLALSDADNAAFRSSVLQTERLSSTLSKLKTVAGILASGRLAADGVILANDAALGLVANAGTLVVKLLPIPTDDLPDPNLNKGIEGSDVSVLQEALLAIGYDLGSSTADGIFGPRTRAAVESYQADTGVKTTGSVSKETFDQIVAQAAQAPPCSAELMVPPLENEFWVLVEEPICAAGWAVRNAYLTDSLASEGFLFRVRGTQWVLESRQVARTVTTTLARGTSISANTFAQMFGARGWPGRVGSQDEVADFIMNGSIDSAAFLPEAWELVAMWLDPASRDQWNDWLYNYQPGQLAPCEPSAGGRLDGWDCHYIGADGVRWMVEVNSDLSAAAFGLA